MNGEVMSMLSEEMTITHSTGGQHGRGSRSGRRSSKTEKSSGVTIVVRGKLEIRAKTTSSKDRAVCLACLVDVGRAMPERTIRFKVNSHHMHEKKSPLSSAVIVSTSSSISPGLSSNNNSSNSSSNNNNSTTTYQCMIPAHPSRKKAMKIMQYVTKEYTSFVHPLLQHLKITPNLLLDRRIDSITKENAARLAYRIKISKNPAADWSRFTISNIKVVAVFPAALPKGCKLLCKPKATFNESDLTLTWNVDEGMVNKYKIKNIYLDAMFTHQPAGGEPLSASLDAGNEEEVRPRLTVVFQVKSKGRGDYYGGTNTSVIFHPAKHSSKLKATMKGKMLVTIRL
jgi:hypothetical protein